jgi:glutathione S-transferase
MYKLFYSPGGANMAPHAVLIETGAEYELIKIDDEKNEQKSPDYLKFNPHGRVPTLLYDGDKVMYESAAICLFLTERHPQAGLAPAPGHADRGRFLQWMAYLTNTVQEDLMHWWHPEYYIGGAEPQAGLKAIAEERLGRMFGFLDGELAKPGPHLCGAGFYACDYFLAMLARWTREMAKPATVQPNVRKLVAASLARPAYQRMLKEEGIAQAV